MFIQANCGCGDRKHIADNRVYEGFKALLMHYRIPLGYYHVLHRENEPLQYQLVV